MNNVSHHNFLIVVISWSLKYDVISSRYNVIYNYRYTFMDCFFPIPIPPINCVIQPFFSNFFFRLLVWIFEWSVCRWKWSALILCFFLTRDVPRPVRSRDVECIYEVSSFLHHLWCQCTRWRHTPLTSLWIQQSSSSLRPKVGSNFQILILQIRANYLFIFRFLV